MLEKCNKPNMRTLKEIYQLVLDEIQDDEYYIGGICHTISTLYQKRILTPAELKLVSDHFQKQFPKKGKFFGLIGSVNKKFAKSKSFTGTIYPAHYYWFYLGEKGRETRIEFLKHIISKLDEKPKTPFTGSNLISAIRSFVNKLRGRS